MRFCATADTDIGTLKQTNQDSVLIKHARSEMGEVLLAAICDGMGGLQKGELASAEVVRRLSRWFDDELPYELDQFDLKVIAGKITWLLKDLNLKISEYSQTCGITMGTTCTVVFFTEHEYVVIHVGDTRFYELNSKLTQLTTDQTFIAREVQRGTLTQEQAKYDKRRNMLLQCVGASRQIEPEVIYGKTQKGIYMLCSDGFRHEISEEEIYTVFNPSHLIHTNRMEKACRTLIEQVKERGEKDNISVLLVKVD